jgi:hypothetical protein
MVSGGWVGTSKLASAQSKDGIISHDETKSEQQVFLQEILDAANAMKFPHCELAPKDSVKKVIDKWGEPTTRKDEDGNLLLHFKDKESYLFFRNGVELSGIVVEGFAHKKITLDDLKSVWGDPTLQAGALESLVRIYQLTDETVVMFHSLYDRNERKSYVLSYSIVYGGNQ